MAILSKRKKQKNKTANNKTVSKPRKAKELINGILKVKEQVPEQESVRKKKIFNNRKITVKIKDKEIQLTHSQKRFCEIYTSSGEFFANGVQSYIQAYDIDISEPGAYSGAKSSAYNLLTNTDILEYINELLQLGNLNDAFVDKQLEFVITQNAELGAKIAGIREYNKLKSRITEKLKIEGDLNIQLDENPVGDYAEYIKNKIKQQAKDGSKS